jgi:hypothetical protein
MSTGISSVWKVNSLAVCGNTMPAASRMTPSSTASWRTGNNA